ncbi:MAG: hypothetical protein P8H53_08945 [Paracoccaceae bacterium]|nr:hypothetical protein [Paracoccaceae bacterium]
MKHLILALSVLASPAVADAPMTAEEFDAFVTGKTLRYLVDGVPYGAERYRENRRVTWSFVEGQDVAECEDGMWYPQEQSICFVYEGGGDPQCWDMYEREGRLDAKYRNDADSNALYEAKPTSDPLLCLGPNVGV